MTIGSVSEVGIPPVCLASGTVSLIVIQTATSLVSIYYSTTIYTSAEGFPTIVEVTYTQVVATMQAVTQLVTASAA